MKRRIQDGFSLIELVIPLLLSARAHSHSVQSMERFHEEYALLGDRDAAIVRSYKELFGPAMVAILSDAIAIFTLIVARIPVIQKLAILSSFWILSIFVSVVTLHPVLLSLLRPPAAAGAAPSLFDRAHRGFSARAAFLFPVRDAIVDLPPRAAESV